MKVRRAPNAAGPYQPVDALERDLVEIEAAIELVFRGVATRVTVGGLRDPEAIAGAALAAAQAAGVRFSLERTAATTGTPTVRIGPRMPEPC